MDYSKAMKINLKKCVRNSKIQKDTAGKEGNNYANKNSE